MSKLKNWLRWVWGWLCRPRKCWRLWRQKRHSFAVSAQVLVHSIRCGSAEQLAGTVPGIAFDQSAHQARLALRLPAGGDVVLEIESLSQKRLPFLGCFTMQSDVRRGMHEILPIPHVILEPYERRVITLRVIHGGVIDGLVIPSFVPKPKREA